MPQTLCRVQNQGLYFVVTRYGAVVWIRVETPFSCGGQSLGTCLLLDLYVL